MGEYSVDIVSMFSYRLAYVCMNIENIMENEFHGTLVTVDNVCLERRVCRGRHWNNKWRDNIDWNSSESPKSRVHGTVVGYVDDEGQLVGENSGREYNQVQQGKRGWCVVVWDNGKRSVYPIGDQGVYALAFVNYDE